MPSLCRFAPPSLRRFYTTLRPHRRAADVTCRSPSTYRSLLSPALARGTLSGAPDWNTTAPAAASPSQSAARPSQLGEVLLSQALRPAAFEEASFAVKMSKISCEGSQESRGCNQLEKQHDGSCNSLQKLIEGSHLSCTEATVTIGCVPSVVRSGIIAPRRNQNCCSSVMTFVHVARHSLGRTIDGRHSHYRKGQP